MQVLFVIGRTVRCTGQCIAYTLLGLCIRCAAGHGYIHTYMYMYRITAYDDWLLRYGVFSHSGLTANLNICKSDLIYVGDIFLEILRRTMDPYELFFFNRFSKKLSGYFEKMPTVVVVTNMRVDGRTDGRTTTQTEGEAETDR